MLQQINLYQPVFRQPPKVFSAITLLQICAAVLVLLSLLAGHAGWTLAGMEATATELDQQLSTLQGKLGSVEAAQKSPDTMVIDADISGLQADIGQRQLLLGQLDQLALQNKGGFAGRFAALAEIQLKGLWLEGVSINADQQIEIRGMALDPRLVPIYIQQLERQTRFTGSRFETLSMTRVSSDQPYIQFVLRNIGEHPL
jgi:hypothetical protein